MAFDFEAIFKEALQAGITAAKPGGKKAQEWVRKSAQANRDTLNKIAQGVASGNISRETGAMLFDENFRALHSETIALVIISKAAAQAGINAFMKSLGTAIGSALKLAI